jgi:membrane protein involved in colicin uptake
MKQNKKLDIQDRKALTLWAADCAEHVLPYFEKERPKDDRPRKAIEAARKWAHGKIKVGEARRAAFSAHAAARKANQPAAIAAARSAGHAAATAHVASHASHAAEYAVKAAEAARFKNQSRVL